MVINAAWFGLCVIAPVVVHIPHVYAEISKTCSASEPCRTKFQVRFSSGAVFVQTDATPCVCENEVKCPQDWSLSGQVVNQSLSIPGFQADLKLMFCKDLDSDDLKTCAPGDTAAVFQSSLQFPTDLTSYACRCPDDQPLQLRMRQFKDQQYINTYICDSSVAECEKDNFCMKSSGGETTYYCKCPESTACSPQIIFTAGQQAVEGYCV